MARVRVVEDESSLREVVAEALEDSGHRTTVASDGAQAIRRLAEQEFDVVISDITMPGGMSGIDLVEYIRAANHSTKVVLVSGHARAQLPDLPEHTTFLPKPYRIGQLLALVKD